MIRIRIKPRNRCYGAFFAIVNFCNVVYNKYSNFIYYLYFIYVREKILNRLNKIPKYLKEIKYHNRTTRLND